MGGCVTNAPLMPHLSSLTCYPCNNALIKTSHRKADIHNCEDKMVGLRANYSLNVVGSEINNRNRYHKLKRLGKDQRRR